MARISEVPESAIADELRPLYERFTGEYGDFRNQLGVVAHSPVAFRHLYGLIDAWRAEGNLSRRVVEIAVVTASRVNECSYCVGHHGKALIELGLPADTVSRILEPEPPGLDAAELAVRDYARLVAERAWGIPEHVYQALQAHFSDAQVAELTLRIGICILFNKLNQALQLDMEDSVQAALSESGLEIPRERR